MQTKDSPGAFEYADCGLIELKFATAPDTPMSFSGYGSVFGNIDSHGDTIAPGAFADTIRAAKSSGKYPAMLSQHGGLAISADDMTPIGVWTNLEEDSKGLRLDGVLAPTPRGQEMHALMKMQPRPAITGLSIGFKAVRWDPGQKGSGVRRILREIKLYEISPVTFPSNTAAQIYSVRSRSGLRRPTDIRSFEALLRDELGFSVREAKRLAASGWSAMTKVDADRSKELAEAIRAAANAIKPSNS